MREVTKMERQSILCLRIRPSCLCSLIIVGLYIKFLPADRFSETHNDKSYSCEIYKY